MKTCRSSTDRMIAGGCGGLAEHLVWSASRLRIVGVVATVFTDFAGIIVYLALCYLMPKAPPTFEPAMLQPWNQLA